MQKITFSLLLFIASVANAQFSEQWAIVNNASDYDRAHGVAVLNDGSYIICGYTYEDKTGSYLARVVKLNHAGNEVWSKNYGAAGTDIFNEIIQTKTGNLLAIGYTSSKGEGDKDVWAVMLDKEGKVLWEKTYGGKFEDKAYCVLPSQKGYLIGGHKMVKSSSNIDAWVLEIDTAGNLIWDKTYPNSFRTYIKDIVPADNGYIVAGYLHPGSGEKYKEDMGRLLKIDENGGLLWEQILGDEKEEQIYSITNLKDGGYAFAGFTESKGKGYHDMWLGVTDAEGNIKWDVTAGDNSEDHAVGVVENEKGLVVLGYVNSRKSNSKDIVLQQYNLQGKLLSETFFGDGLNNTPHQLMPTPDGGFVLAGEVCTHYQYNSKPVKCKMEVIKTLGNPVKSVEHYVSMKLKSWEKRGEFEKTEDYQKRVTEENRERVIAKHTREAIDYFAGSTIDLTKTELSRYNADKEEYLLQVPGLGEFPLQIGIDDAQSLKERWDIADFEEVQYKIEEGKFVLSKAVLVVHDKELTYNTDKAPGTFTVTGKRQPSPLTSRTRGGGGDPLKGLNVSSAKDNLQTGNYYALIVGIDNYKGHWSPLNNAVRDAQAVELTLKKQYKFNNFKTLYDEQATRENIINALSWLVNNVKPQDNVFIYYSGHGDFNKKLNKGFWVPADAQTSSVAAYISNSDIQTFLNGINSSHTLLVADACFSGDIFRGNTVKVDFENSEKYYKEVYKLKSRQAITSGGLEPVMDGGRNGHSVFAYYFLKSLQSNQHEYLDAATLYESLKVPVANNSDQTPSLQPVKNTGDEGGQFIFIKK